MDDGSTDHSRLLLKKLAAADWRHRFLAFERNAGQSAAFWVGFRHAGGAILVTMDGDGQNDPADIPHLVAMVRSGQTDMAHGYRRKREDNEKSAKITVANPWEDFHVYAMEWHADRIDVFVDGEKYFTFRNEATGSATWPFDKPQYLLVNLAIGGSWGGQKGIDDARFPHKYYVDYVRIYQQK